MGAKDSKPSFITYEDAVKRVSDSELRRIREAFKRCAGVNGTSLSLEAFVREVLSDGVPFEVADWLYQACGGTKRGIAFKELLCGIVVLTKGNIEEKIKFLWTLYVNNQGDNGTYIYKWDFAGALHMENMSLAVTEAHRSMEILTSLFGPNDKVTFEQFRSWLLIHKDATVLSKWLLSGRANAVQELDTPTFYQSLAGVTHLEERDIIELEKCFWALRNAAATGQLDAPSLAPLLAPPLPRAAVAGVFLAFDENRDGHVDFKELCCGLSAACRGPRTERLKFCFKIFDLDRDGVLNKQELIDMVGILCSVANESLKHQGSRASTPSDDSEGEKGFDPEVVLLNLRDKLVTNVPKNGKRPVFHLGPDEGDAKKETKVDKIDSMNLIAMDTALTLEEFLIWSVESADSLLAPFLQLLFEVCHVVLGLRPHCKHQERDIVLGWLRRSEQCGYSVGQFWYLVAAEWWAGWAAHTAGCGACCRAPRAPDDALGTDESFTTSTESMGSLLWRAETASLGSASSSGVSSAAAQRARAPGPIDNRRLLAPSTLKVRTLTGEGGHLRRDVTLAQHRDFELVPDALWRALALWYGGADPLPRQVIRPPNSDVELELYPLNLKILRHVAVPQRVAAIPASGVAMYGHAPPAPAPPAAPERQLMYTAAFSRLATVRQVSEFLCTALGLAREDVRLWTLGTNATATLLDDERFTLQELRCDDRTRILLEVRNADLTWPEEIGALSMSSGNRAMERRETLVAPNLPGATGLHNLGNTCYMNAALQSVWNTGPLTKYFNSGMHLYEVNTTNPLGTKGALAIRYGELCKEVWSCSARSVAPLRVRWCVSRHARALAGGGQHDAQELLAWLLDTLHEDLNRAGGRAPPLRDSNGRPDQEVAEEAWAAHTARNSSIVTDLFYGQLKSRVRCDACGAESTRFDAFNMLSLPLPVEQTLPAIVVVILLDGSVPVKYGVLVNSEGTYLDLKKKLSELCGLAPESMMIVELNGATIGRVSEDGAKISAASARELYAYEVPAAASHDCDDCLHDTEWGADADAGAAGGARAEVSARAANPSSLCMPALFCFKRSKSEILMSQSPPTTFYKSYEDRTFPSIDRSHLGNSSPTLSVKSLNIKPSSPRLARVKFGSSPSNMNKMNEVADSPKKIQYLVAVHRKQTRMDAYFLPSQRSKPALFGVPILVGIEHGMSGRDVYARVWTQVARLLSARPPPSDACNHATDCDDSLGYEFPFTLRLVSGGGAWCALCPWPALCRGCALPSAPAGTVSYVTLRLVSGGGAWCALCPWPALCRGCALPSAPAGTVSYVTLRLVSGGGAWCALCPWPALCRGCALPSAPAGTVSYVTLRLVSGGGAWCALCPWPALCRGCALPSAPAGTVSYVTLRLVSGGGAWCALCPWPALCRGCALPSAPAGTVSYVTLRLVSGGGAWCALCPWPALCRGCALPSAPAGTVSYVTLRLVSGGGAWCALCPWPALCRGCALPSAPAGTVSYVTLRLVSGGGAWCALCPWPALCRGCALPSAPAGTVSYVTLRLVSGGGAWCALCPWPALCRGCALPSAPAGTVSYVTLRLVSGGGAWCALCPWPALCRGCALPSAPADEPHPPLRIDTDAPDSSSPIARAKLRRTQERSGDEEDTEETLLRLNCSVLRQLARCRRGALLAIDWDPTALHLRYQPTREKAWAVHASVAESLAQAARPVDLASCLRAFTSCERLDEKYACARCRRAQPATKALQIWRLPPILIIHLKRFQYVNNKWIKSTKVVNFPYQDFDPTPYLASVPQETILRHQEMTSRRSSLAGGIAESDTDEETTDTEHTKEQITRGKINKRRSSIEGRRRSRLESTSLLCAPVCDDHLEDYHRHHLQPAIHPLDLKYRLYAVVSHSGQMSGGHYVAYARNPSGSWLCYNDSMCRELPHSPPAIDPASGYLLFYQRQGLRAESYLPDISGKEPVIKDSDVLDPDESDLRKMCVIA